MRRGAGVCARDGICGGARCADREMHAKGLYNFKLAIQKVDGKNLEIIGNDFEFAPDH